MYQDKYVDEVGVGGESRRATDLIQKHEARVKIPINAILFYCLYKVSGTTPPLAEM